MTAKTTWLLLPWWQSPDEGHVTSHFPAHPRLIKGFICLQQRFLATKRRCMTRQTAFKVTCCLYTIPWYHIDHKCLLNMLDNKVKSVNQQDFSFCILIGLQSMAVFEELRFLAYCIITHLKISSYWLLKKELWNKICPEVHLLLRELDHWNTWPDYKLYVKAEPQDFC